MKHWSSPIPVAEGEEIFAVFLMIGNSKLSFSACELRSIVNAQYIIISLQLRNDIPVVVMPSTPFCIYRPRPRLPSGKLAAIEVVSSCTAHAPCLGPASCGIADSSALHRISPVVLYFLWLAAAFNFRSFDSSVDPELPCRVLRYLLMQSIPV